MLRPFFSAAMVLLVAHINKAVVVKALILQSSLHIQRHSLSSSTRNNKSAIVQKAHERNGSEKIRLIDKDTSLSTVDRRTLFRKSAVTMLSSTMMILNPNSNIANAYDKLYPIELTSKDANIDVDSRARRVNRIILEQNQRRSMFDSDLTQYGNSLLWGIALWLLSGSRSNPIATPLANLIYKVEQEEWLQDRNEGLFASLPWEFLIILSAVFGLLGYGMDTLVTNLAEGERDISLQLVGVTIIGGCSLELGRIASGQKKQTREQSERNNQLVKEFELFAEQRLRPGGNCHRSEVVSAFRRFYAKYRQNDSEEYPLTDIEIEQLLRTYCRAIGKKMSQAGFYQGIQINQDADVFVRDKR